MIPYKEETQLVGRFLTKSVVELMVKILDKYTCKEFLRILMKCKFEDIDK